MLVSLNRVADDWVDGDHNTPHWDYVACCDVLDEVFPSLEGEDEAVFEVTDEPHDGGVEFMREGLRIYRDGVKIHHGYLYRGLRKVLPEGVCMYVSKVS